MVIDIDQDKSFDLPEDYFRVKLIENKPLTKFKNGKAQTYCRLVWQVIDGVHAGKFAGRNFLPSLGRGSQLRDFLENWLGESFFQTNAANRFDMQTLVGKEGDLLINHIVNGPNIPPFRQVAAVYPPGQFVSVGNQSGRAVLV